MLGPPPRLKPIITEKELIYSHPNKNNLQYNYHSEHQSKQGPGNVKLQGYLKLVEDAKTRILSGKRPVVQPVVHSAHPWTSKTASDEPRKGKAFVQIQDNDFAGNYKKTINENIKNIVNYSYEQDHRDEPPKFGKKRIFEDSSRMNRSVEEQGYTSRKDKQSHKKDRFSSEEGGTMAKLWKIQDLKFESQKESIEKVPSEYKQFTIQKNNSFNDMRQPPRSEKEERRPAIHTLREQTRGTEEKSFGKGIAEDEKYRKEEAVQVDFIEIKQSDIQVKNERKPAPVSQPAPPQAQRNEPRPDALTITRIINLLREDLSMCKYSHRGVLLMMTTLKHEMKQAKEFAHDDNLQYVVSKSMLDEDLMTDLLKLYKDDQMAIRAMMAVRRRIDKSWNIEVHCG